MTRSLVVVMAGTLALATAALQAGTAQTITFPAVADRVTTDAPFALGATASSGLPVTYSITSPAGVAAVAGGSVTLTGAAGAVTVKASQEGDGTHDAATPAYRTFSVLRPSERFVTLATGPETVMGAGIRADGTLWTWGSGDSTYLLNSYAYPHTCSPPSQVGTATNWTAVSCGRSHITALRADGTLWAGGYNNTGQIGDGTTTYRNAMVQVGTATNWTAVACGNQHTLALRADGTLWAWGNNASRQIGDGTSTTRLAPVQIGSSRSWAQVACGRIHSLAVATDGTLWTWGSNSDGQLGDGSTTQRNSPVQVGTATTWARVAGGSSHSVAVRTDGTLWAWGANLYGQLGDGTTTLRNSPVQIGAATDWSRVACGRFHTIALRTGGSLWTWGENLYGKLGDGTLVNRNTPGPVGGAAGSTTWVEVGGGGFHSVALSSSGTLWSWGQNSTGQLGSGRNSTVTSPLQVQEAGGGNPAGWSMIATGNGNHSGAVRADGSLWIWGDNDYGQLGDGTLQDRPSLTQAGSGSQWSAVDCGSQHTVALRADGTLWAWGTNTYGQLGDGTTISRRSPVQTGNTAGWTAVDCGNEHTVALRADGTLWAWGSNSSGQLGDGTLVNQNAPVQIGTVTTWSKIACGSNHTLALRADGTLWAWGAHAMTETDGTPINPRTQVRVGSFTDWVAVSGGQNHSLALRADGSLWGWGYNFAGQLGDGTTTSSTTLKRIGTGFWDAVSCGRAHTVALRRDGTLWAWGDNDYGQLGDGTLSQRLLPTAVGNAANWAAVAGSGLHTVGLRTDGTLWSWGNNQYFQTGNQDTSQPGRIYPPRSSQGLTSPVLPAAPTPGQPLALTGSASSGLPVTFTVAGPATLVGNVLTPAGPGTITVVAYQNGDTVWSGVEPLVQKLHLGPRVAVAGNSRPLILPSTSPNLDNHTDFGAVGIGTGTVTRSFTLTNTGNMALALQPASITGTHAADFTVVVAPVSPVAAGGSSVLQITFTPGAAGLRQATVTLATDDPRQAQVAFAIQGTGVSGTAQVVTFPSPGDRFSTDAPFTLDATASSGLPVTYTIVSPGGVATLNGSTVTLTGTPGSVTVSATQAGGGAGGHAAAQQVLRTFVVADAAQRFVKLSTGLHGFTGAGIRADGTLWTWGQRFRPDEESPPAAAPVQLGTASTWAEVALGTEHGMALRTDGTLWGWGLNNEGQLGIGTTTSSLVPVQVGTATWKAVACGSSHTVAVRTDGTLWTWGDNGYLQLGDGTSTDRTTPVQIGTDSTWTTVACGQLHSAALQADGTLWTWGNNANWELGVGGWRLGFGEPGSRNSPTQVGTGLRWKAVACGATHTVACNADGTVWAWGSNFYGQGGAEGPVNSNGWGVPLMVAGLDNCVSVASGMFHNLARRADGTLWSWGQNTYGQLGDGTMTQRHTPAPVGEGLAWTQAAGGPSHSLALRADGTLWAWGSNGRQEHGSGTPTHRADQGRVGTATDWVSLSTRMDHTLALRAGGTLWGWGMNGAGQVADGTLDFVRPTPAQVVGSGPWASAAAGGYHSVALRADNTLWTAGWNDYGQLGDGGFGSELGQPQPQFGQIYDMEPATWLKVAAGDGHCLALRSDGILFGWGRGDRGQLGFNGLGQPEPPEQLYGSDWADVACGERHNIGLRRDGTLWGWGENSVGQCGASYEGPSSPPLLITQQIGSATNWTTLACGWNHNAALRADGSLWTWGYTGHVFDLYSNPHLGDMRQINVGSRWKAVACGASHTVAVRADGTLWAWGFNGSGQLGDGTTTDRATPVQISTATDWCAVACGQGHTVALRADGSLWSWGGNGEGQLGRAYILRPTRSWMPRGGQMLSCPALPADLAPGQSVPLAATASSGLPVSYTVSGPATLSGHVLTVTGIGAISITSHQEGDSSWAIADSLQQTASTITAQQNWRQTHFGTTANTSTAADTFDADHDGLANLIEYAFGLSPVAGASVQLPVPMRAGNTFTVSFTEPAGVSGVTYGASYSTSLQNGTWVPIPDTGSGTTHIFSAPVQANDTKVFIQLSVTATP